MPRKKSPQAAPPAPTALDISPVQEALESVGANLVSSEFNGAQASLQIDMSHANPGLRKALGNGFIFNRYNPIERSGWYSSFTSDILPFTRAMQLPAQPHDIMKLSTELYYTDELIGTVVDLLVDFSAGGLELECEDDKVLQWFNEWAEDVDLFGLVYAIFLEYYRTANVFVFKQLNEDDQIPMGYTLLDPIQTEVQGSLMFNQEEVAININRELVEMVRGPVNETASVLESLPVDLVAAIRQGQNHVALPKNQIARITRKRQPYERYATTFLNRVFWPALYKQKLRLMDLSVVEGTTNQILLVKLGNDKFPVDQDTMTRFSQLIQTPSKAFSLVWNHAIEMDFVVPKGVESILNAEKYKPINEEILIGLGIPRLLIDGQSTGGMSSGWISVLGLVERIESGRKDVTRWLNQEFKLVAELKGFKKVPRAKFRKLNLRSDQTFKNVILSLYDRGLISAESALDQANFSYNVELKRKESEVPNRELFMPAQLPYYGGNNNDPAVQTDAKPTDKDAQVGPPTNGRPSGNTDNKYSDRGMETPRMGKSSRAEGATHWDHPLDSYADDQDSAQRQQDWEQQTSQRWDDLTATIRAIDADPTLSQDDRRKKS